MNELKCPLLSPVAQDLLSAPASESYVEVNCIFGLRGADSRQAKPSHQGPCEEIIPENEQKILWIGLLSTDTDNDTGSYA